MSSSPLFCLRTQSLPVVLQFVTVLEANIFAKINALVNVTITKVTTGSAIVENTVAFTSSDSASAAAGRSALFQTLQSGDTTIFGTTFGSVAVSNVTQGTADNPGKCLQVPDLFGLCRSAQPMHENVCNILRCLHSRA